MVVDCESGEGLGSGEHAYAHGVMDRELAAGGQALGPGWALQDPRDYLEALRESIALALRCAGVDPAEIAAIGTDFTACTVLPVRADGLPLCAIDGLESRPHAYAKLWRHHAAQGQADRITELARERREPWLGRYGGRVSSEWELPKGLELLEQDPELYERMDRLVEGADWIVWQLCGRESRSPSVAGYKGTFQDGAYPSPDFLRALNPAFGSFATAKLGPPRSSPRGCAGPLSEEGARRLVLVRGTPVSGGRIDAHATAPAARAVGPGRMVAVMGTSTCHLMVDRRLVEFPGLAGVARDGIVPGAWGYEAGQSGVGDIFAWYVREGVPAQTREQARRRGLEIHEHLTSLAAELAVGESGLLALDWWSGNRSVLMDHDLSGAIVGLTLGTRPAEIYRALLEATAFGTRRIIEAFEEAGLSVGELVAAGGLTHNELLMQIYADVTERPLGVIGAPHGAALGAAMHASVAAGIYRDIGTASERMGAAPRRSYVPDPRRARSYGQLYEIYRRLHDWFGVEARDIMRDLRALSAGARS